MLERRQKCYSEKRQYEKIENVIEKQYTYLPTSISNARLFDSPKTILKGESQKIYLILKQTQFIKQAFMIVVPNNIETQKV